MSENNSDREKSEAQEGCNYKWFATYAIGDFGGRNIDQDGSCELHRHEHAVLRNRYAGDVRHIQNGEDVGHPLACSDHYVGQKEPLQDGTDGLPNTMHLHCVPGWSRKIDCEEYWKSDSRERERNQESHSYPKLDPQCPDKRAAKERRNHHRDAFKHGLNCETHCAPLLGERVAYSCKDGR